MKRCHDGLSLRMTKGIPIFVTVGPKEVSAGTVTIRERGGKRSVRSLSDATAWLKAINASD